MKFAYPAIRMFGEAMADKGEFYYTGTEGDSQMTVEGIAKFIECGYKNNCLIKEVQPVFKYEHFYEWAEKAITDEDVAKQIAAVLECYAQTEYAKKLQELTSTDEKKN